MKNSIKSISVPPSPERLIDSLTQIGYSFQTAIADLVDNSIQADASEVYIDMCSVHEVSEPYVVICDNGRGMNKKSLVEAMRFGSKEKYSHRNLGKFGLGLKTASLSQCRVLTVISKPRIDLESKSRLNICKWDMNYVYGNNKWDVLNPKENELEDHERYVLEKYRDDIEKGGTLIIWSDMKEFHPDLYEENKNKRESFIVHLIDGLKSHLGLTFHRFLEGSVSNKKRLKISFDDQEIESINPFCKKEKVQQPDKKIYHFDYGKEGNKSKVTFSPYILPREDQFSSPESYKKASSLGTWLSCQGFYFYRNNRLLKYGDWSSCAKKDKKNILLRVAVDFNEKMDVPFEINISKEKATIPKKYKSEISKILKDWLEQSRKRHIGKNGVKEPESEKNISQYKNLIIGDMIEIKPINHGREILLKRNIKENKIILSVPKTAEFSEFLQKRNGRVNKFRDLSICLILLLEAVKRKKIKRDHLPSLEELKQFLKED